jgi:uncharacterized protein YuzE
MGTTLRQIQSPEIKLETIDNIRSFTPVYIKDNDTLLLRPDRPQPATSVDINGELWLRIDVESGEVVGVEIEDFESVFLKKHPELARAWQDVKPLCHRKLYRTSETTWQSFLLIVLDFLRTLFAKNPYQIRAEIVPA